jgi:hypothetical protein
MSDSTVKVGNKALLETAVVVLRVPDVQTACESARQHNGRTSLACDAPMLPFRNCGQMNCRCHYERLTDRRRGQRRKQTDRREEIRFELKKEDRRKSDRRKTTNPWSRDL